MSLFGDAGLTTSTMFPYLNTGTPFDVAIGTYELGVDNSWYLYGGCGPVNLISGKNGCYKTSTVDSLCGNILSRYPRVELIKLDTEQTYTNASRYSAITGDKSIESRITITNAADIDGIDFFKLVIQAMETKIANKDNWVTTPFVDRATGTALRMPVPSLVVIDSFTEFWVAGLSLMETLKIADASSNTIFMTEGKVKKLLISQMTRWARKYGIYFFLTQHIGKKIDIGPMHTPKQTQWINRAEEIKGGGSGVLFLPNVSLLANMPVALAQKDGTATYPMEGASDNIVDTNKLELRVLRGKSGVTGTVVSCVMSQRYGLRPGLSNYDYLVSNQDYGFDVSGYTRRNKFLPDVAITRKTVQQLLANKPELERALELTQQLHWINRFWDVNKFSIKIPKTIDNILEGIAGGKSKLTVDDILHSRGYWSYDDEHLPPHLSLMDIIDMLNGHVSDHTVQVPDTLVTIPETKPKTKRKTT